MLVVLPTWVGDFVMATPTLRAIRNRFGGARITFLIEPNLRELVRGGDWMDECVEWPAKDRRMPWHREYRALAADLRRRRLDLAILLPNSARAAMIAFFAKAKRRVGYNRGGRGLLLTDRIPVKNRLDRRARRSSAYQSPKRKRGVDQPVACAPGSDSWSRHPSRHAGRIRNPQSAIRNPSFLAVPIVEYYADLAEAVGCERPGDRLELFTTPDCDRSVDQRLKSLDVADRHPLVVISPGAKYGAAKCWLPERFAAVGDRLIEERKAAVIVTCGPGEESIARTIGSAMKQRGLVFDDPLLTLGELKSLVNRCDLLICNDAGPRHFAKAFDVPVVTVFGPTHPEWTATSYEAERIVRIDLDCGPCQ
ncbi:MAG: glycosyltransferase family 9 protein, partial [Planctomycetota bacterium]